MFRKPLINTMETTLRNYLKETKNLTDEQIDKKMLAISPEDRISFIQSLQTVGGEIRAIRLLNLLPIWDTKINHDELIFNYLSSRMGTSKDLVVKLLTDLAKSLNVYEKAEELHSYMLSSLPAEGAITTPFTYSLKACIKEALTEQATNGREMTVLDSANPVMKF